MGAWGFTRATSRLCAAQLRPQQRVAPCKRVAQHRGHEGCGAGGGVHNTNELQKLTAAPNRLDQLRQLVDGCAVQSEQQGVLLEQASLPTAAAQRGRQFGCSFTAPGSRGGSGAGRENRPDTGDCTAWNKGEYKTWVGFDAS